MVSIIPKSEVTPSDIKQLRELCSLSIGEIKAACEASRPICHINIFGQHDAMSDETRKHLLVRIANEMKGNANVPYRAFEVHEDGSQEELSAEGLVGLIKHYRHIEVEQRMLADLENGYIQDRDEFEPHDEDWTLELG